MTLDELIARRDALQKAIYSGAITVRHGDSSITYRDLRQMLDALAMIEGQIARANAVETVRAVRVIAKDTY